MNGSLVFVVHCFVIPIPLGVNVLSAIASSKEGPSAAITNGRYDSSYGRWARRNFGGSRVRAENFGRMLWSVWPLVLMICLVWFFLSVFILRVGHKKSLQDYAAGLKYRNEQYLFVDLSRAAR